METEELIANELVRIIDDDVPSIKFVTFDRVRLSTDEFRNHEIPAVQFFDLNQSIRHQRPQVEVMWTIALELIMKQTTEGVVEQKDLWALRREIEVALWQRPNLGVPGVVQMHYRNNLTDLHLLQPFYIARMEFDVQFLRGLTGSC